MTTTAKNGSMSAQHTPGAWYVEGANPPRIYANNGLEIIAQCDSAKEMTKAGELANAARIVACVNACEGMADPEVWIGMKEKEAAFAATEIPRLAGQVDSLSAEVERLREALAQAVRYVEVQHAYRGAMTAAEVEAAIIANASIAEVRIGANSCNTLAAFDLFKARAALGAGK